MTFHPLIYSDITHHTTLTVTLSPVTRFSYVDTIANPSHVLLAPDPVHLFRSCQVITKVLLIQHNGPISLQTYSPLDPLCPHAASHPLSVTLMMMMTRDVSVMSWTFVAGEDKTIVQSRRHSHCQSHCCHCPHVNTPRKLFTDRKACGGWMHLPSPSINRSPTYPDLELIKCLRMYLP